MKAKWVVVGLVVVVTVALVAVAWTADEGCPTGHGQGAHMAKRACMAQLTPEQREELKATIAPMREAGASKQEIHQAVAGLFEGWGIECPQRRPGQGIFQQLTPEQREQLKAKIAEMKEAGASKEEIHQAVVEMLKDWGVKRPQRRLGQGGILQQLTPEQRQELKDMVAELKEAGASKEEIHQAVAEQLQDWGVERPQRPGKGIFQQLAPEQRQELKDMLAQMKEDGASKEEIREAVRDLLEGWGIAPKPQE